VLSPPVRLSDLPVGTVARLARADVDDESRRLLRALGLVDASRLRLCTDGEPYIVQVRATRIGLSKAVARGLYVTVEPTGSS
jgi:Fe2+ transport system protein FeoA